VKKIEKEGEKSFYVTEKSPGYSPLASFNVKLSNNCNSQQSGFWYKLLLKQCAGTSQACIQASLT